MRRSAVLSAVVLSGVLVAGVSAREQPPTERGLQVDTLADNRFMLRRGGGNTAEFVAR